MSPPPGLLCIDAGNTRVKWCVVPSAAQPFALQTEFFSHPTAGFKPGEHLQRCIERPQHAVHAVLLSNVLGPDFEQGVRAVCENKGLPLHVLEVNAHGQVQSVYKTPSSLGKDRWAACLAVTQVSDAAVNLLVSFGTATTLDVVVKAGYWQHLGGYIVPGVQTMLNSLHSNTAELPKVELKVEYVSKLAQGVWPTTTQQAIGEGVARMQAALLESVVADLAQQHGAVPAVWLSGGFARAMQALFPKAQLLEHAVFKGLLVDYQLAQEAGR